MPGPSEVTLATVGENPAENEAAVLLAIQRYFADGQKIRSSPPGTVLSSGAVLAGGGVKEVGEGAVSAIVQARDTGAAALGASRDAGLAALGQAVVTGTATVNAAVAGASAALQAFINQGAALRTETQGYRNEAAVSAAQSNFAGYAGSWATYAAFGSPAGKANGAHLVKTDVNHGGLPWAYLVAGGAVTDSWGVPLLNATMGITLLGPIRSNGAADWDFVYAAAADPGNAAVRFQKWKSGAINYDGTFNEGLYFGFLGANGGFHNSYEQNYRPYFGKHWIEAHWEVILKNLDRFRVISMETDQERRWLPDGSLYGAVRMRIEGDEINVFQGGPDGIRYFSCASKQKRFPNAGTWAGDAERNGVVGFGERIDVTIGARGQIVFTKDSTEGITGIRLNLTNEIELGGYQYPVRLPRFTRVGDYSEETRLSVHGAAEGGPHALLRLHTGWGGYDGAGPFIEYATGDGPNMAVEKLVARAGYTVWGATGYDVPNTQYSNLFGFRWQRMTATQGWQTVAGLGDNGLFTLVPPGGGLILTSPDGATRKLYRLGDNGAMELVNPPS